MGHSVTTLKVNTIEPAGSTLTLGASGDSVVLADDVKSNTYKDAGGNTLFTSDGSGNLSSVNSGFGDSIKLLSTTTASGNASIEFTLPTTYKQVVFKFIGIHGSASTVELQAEFYAGSGYADKAKTTTFFRAAHKEDGSAGQLGYQTGFHLAQANTPKKISRDIGNDNDHNISGELILYNPAGTTYVTNFQGRSVTGHSTDIFTYDSHFGGYVNATVAVEKVKFSMASGNIDSGKIKMYGML